MSKEAANALEAMFKEINPDITFKVVPVISGPMKGACVALDADSDKEMAPVIAEPKVEGATNES